MATTRIIFGCGYLGRRVAQLWHDDGSEVFPVTRSPQRADDLRREGLSAIVADVTQPETLTNLPAVETVLFAVGFDHSADSDMHTVYAQGMSNVLDALPASVSRLLYISTTGVYGSADGGWVDEQTPPNPQREGGRASLEAEEVLRRHPLGARSVILRLAGIYGPGRVPYLDKLRAGEPIAAPSAGWLNLIHVDDAARIVVAADEWAASRQTADGPHMFCVSDGSPAVRRGYYAEVARLIGAPPPLFTAPAAESPAAARAQSDRRFRNDKMRHELQVRLSYPSYREGLAAILGRGANC
jgi:nucleoside-diphosphate-sugar epimerase